MGTHRRISPPVTPPLHYSVSAFAAFVRLCSLILENGVSQICLALLDAAKLFRKYFAFFQNVLTSTFNEWHRALNALCFFRSSFNFPACRPCLPCLRR
jgi:hypothetical protein